MCLWLRLEIPLIVEELCVTVCLGCAVTQYMHTLTRDLHKCTGRRYVKICVACIWHTH